MSKPAAAIVARAPRRAGSVGDVPRSAAAVDVVVVGSRRPRRGPGRARRRARSPAPDRSRRRRAGWALLEDDPVVAEHVVGVELADLDQLHLGEVAERAGRRRLSEAVDDDERRDPRRRARRARALASLVFGASKPQPSTTTTLPSLARSDSAERAASLIIFFGVRWAYAARLGAEGDATAGVVRGVRRALAGVAGALLAVRLGAAAADLAAGLGATACRRAGAASWAVTTWCMSGHVGLDAEDGVVELDVAGVGAGRGLEGDLGHGAQLSWLLTALRTRTTPPLGPGTEPFTQQQVALGVGLDDLEVQRRDLLVAHVAGHPQALEHAAREGARPDRAGGPVVLVVAVAGALALEVVALHRAGEALAPADGGDVDLGAGGDGVDEDLLADLEAVDRVEAQLEEALAGVDRRLGEVAGLGLGELLGVALAVGDLQRAVAVALGGLDLDDAHRLDAQHRHRDDLVVDPLLAHADLLADDRCGCHCGCSLLVLIERPEGRYPHGPGSVLALGVQMLRRPGRAEHPVWLSPCGPWRSPPGAHGHRLRTVPYRAPESRSRHSRRC